MAYLLGDWATDRWTTDCRLTAVDGRRGDRQLISSMFDILPQTGPPATAVDHLPFAQRHTDPVDGPLDAAAFVLRPRLGILKSRLMENKQKYNRNTIKYLVSITIVEL